VKDLPLSWRRLLVLLATFGSCLIAANHGIGPIALLLVLGWNNEWLLPVMTGWVAIGLLIAGQLAASSSRVLPIAGAVLLGASWLCFLRGSERWPDTVLFSLPFLGALALWIERALKVGAPSTRPWK
jgi:hypothetical protein